MTVQSVLHDRLLGMYRLTGYAQGHLDYVDVPSIKENGKVRIFTHTYIQPSFRGKGLANMLAQFAIDDTTKRGMKFNPMCPFVKAYVKKHPELEQHVYR